MAIVDPDKVVSEMKHRLSETNQYKLDQELNLKLKFLRQELVLPKIFTITLVSSNFFSDTGFKMLFRSSDAFEPTQYKEYSPNMVSNSADSITFKSFYIEIVNLFVFKSKNY